MTRTGTPRPGPRHTNDSPIAAARIEAGMTQEQLADILDIPQTQIAKWETGVRHPKVENLAKIAAALNVPLENLLRL